MTLEEELKPHFDAIAAALNKKGDMPRALEAQRHVARAYVSVVHVDDREKYLKDALTPKKGTICIFLEGNLHRPIRKRVLHVTHNAIVTEWHEPKRLTRRFDHQGVQADAMRDHQKELDMLNHEELEELLATACIVRA